MVRTSAIWILLGLLADVASAQQPKPKFEVASVKPQSERQIQPSTDLGVTLRNANPRALPGGVFRPTHATVRSLLRFAYDLKEYQIEGGPEWAYTSTFQINANAGGDVAAAQLKVMVQSLLEDRFRLVTHKEQRVMPHFALQVARSDGQLGPNIQHTDNCASLDTRPPRPPRPPDAASLSGCGPLSVIADNASRRGAPVVDRSGLTGSFHFLLYYSPADAPVLRGRPPLPIPVGPNVENLPSFREALREQLGLRLESVRGPIEVLVIDSVQPPTEN